MKDWFDVFFLIFFVDRRNDNDDDDDDGCFPPRTAPHRILPWAFFGASIAWGVYYTGIV